MRLATRLALAPLVALLLPACTTPYSLVDGQRYNYAAIDTYPVRIKSVDGVDNIQIPVQIDPGPRRITVIAPPAAGFRFGPEETITLDVKPCTRYSLVAVMPNRLSREFTVKVDHEEPVPGCVRPDDVPK